MKILKIIGIVAGIHALALLIIFANPGCSSTTKPQAVVEAPKETPPPSISLASYGTAPSPVTASPISADTPSAPAFNPDAPATGGAIRYSPTRPGSMAASALESQPVADVTPASTYTVTKGDSLWTIAKKNHIPVADLAGANNLRPSATLHLGQKVVIPSKAGSVPPPEASAPAAGPSSAAPSSMGTAPASVPSEGGGMTYTVKNGETLGSIARKFHTTSSKLGVANNITDPRLIRPGQELTIPAASAGRSSGAGKTAAAKSVSTTPPSIPTPANSPADQDLDAGLKPAPAGEVPVIKVEDSGSSPSKN